VGGGTRGVELRLEGVSKRFSRDGRHEVAAVQEVSLEVRPGELLTLLGPSGCGKTTTLRIVAGFEQPDTGRVRIDGQDVTDRQVYRRNTGFVFQNYALFPHLSVLENVAYGLRVRGLAAAEVRARVGAVLELVGLPGYGQRFPHELSGGEQQRVAVARAVVVEPQLLLFDEPLSNLDAKLRVQMRAELLRLQRQLAITTVYVTHDQDEAMALSDRIAVMHRGRLVQVGTARQLYCEPASAFVAQFIGRANLLVGQVQRAEGGQAEVLVWGRPVHVPATIPCRAGEAVSLLLRPESVELHPHGAALPPGPGATGTVQSRTFLGEKVEYRVEVEGTAIEAVTYDPTRRGVYEPGARVWVSCDPAALRLVAAGA
jgi:iron(III) transport system ATP-binding protein